MTEARGLPTEGHTLKRVSHYEQRGGLFGMGRKLQTDVEGKICTRNKELENQLKGGRKEDRNRGAAAGNGQTDYVTTTNVFQVSGQ